MLGNEDPLIQIQNQADLTVAGTIQYVESDASTTTPNVSNTRAEYAKKFGLFYRQYHATLVCPTGWRLPTTQEILDLVDILGGDPGAEPYMRANNKYYLEPGSIYPMQWGEVDPAVAKRSGFDLYPSGMANSTGALAGYSYEVRFWTSTVMTPGYSGYSSTFRLDFSYPGFTLNNGNIHLDYLHIRCMRD